LKVGRPKNATGPIPGPNELLVGNATSIPGVTMNANALKKKTTASILNSLKGMDPNNSGAQVL
jgi:hypothetical protein